ncbi:ankyrin repeat domain-containing protein [Dactylosporangium sp. CS-033363]|uniref:ankyrin repeat domain-containing protein n=1 Tax=Dactylosporangium sp. CS-033363 TaxID=3239935 RepID=UPI003D8E61E5
MSALIPRAALGAWARVRRYAVPRAMIEEATAARLAGDWRAACAAAGVLIGADAAALEPYADDLRHLAPDLLRWHLPRYPASGETTLEPRALVVLARRAGSLLAVATPRVALSTQRVTLVVAGSVDEDRYHRTFDWTAARHLWDAREADRLLTRTLGPDAAATLALQDAGRPREAWALAGVDVPEPPARAWGLGTLDADPAVLVAAARALGTPSALIPLSFSDLRLHVHNGGPARAEWVNAQSQGLYALPLPPFLRPVDLHLVRLGLLSPADLHPLIGPLLEPYATPAKAPRAGAAVRVRCGGEWHELGWEHGRMRMPHTDAERRREEALRALGGEVHGCFAAEQGWTVRSVRLPRHLDEQRRDLLLRMLHGDLAGVTARLDAGLHPGVRDPHGRSLLHLLPCVDWRPGWPELLRRLLDAGLPIDDRDHTGRTPLHAAVRDDGSAELIRALLAAGADPAAEDNHGDGFDLPATLPA